MHESGQVRGLASGRGAHVEHAVVGSHVEHVAADHRRQVLQEAALQSATLVGQQVAQARTIQNPLRHLHGHASAHFKATQRNIWFNFNFFSMDRAKRYWNADLIGFDE